MDNVSDLRQHSSAPSVWIVMGSDSDLRVMSEAAKILESFEISYEISIASAHRCTDYVLERAAAAADNGVEVIIAGSVSGITIVHIVLHLEQPSI